MGGSSRSKPIDSLRAIAALAIVGYHVLPLAGALRSDPVLAVSAQLSTGVALFFLISGLLLYRPFVLAHVASDRLPDVRAYAWRRFLRIVPAYWAALTVMGLLAAPEVFERPLLFYGFAQIYSPGAVFQGIPVAWTLCIEVSFYAFLPLFALFVRGLARGTRSSAWGAEAGAVAALFCVGVAWRSAGLASEGWMADSLNTLPAYFAWFAVGMGLAIVTAWMTTERRIPRPVAVVAGAPTACWLVAGAALAANAWLWDRGYFGGERFGDPGLIGVHLTEAVCALGLLLPAVFGGDGSGAVRRLLATAGLAWLGLVSYGIYVWQSPAVDALARYTPLDKDALDPNLLWLPAGFGGCILAGALSWYLLERHAMKLRRLVPPRREKPTVQEAEEASVGLAP